MIIELGAAKTGRFDSADSDETTEILERPSGGQSIVFCSGKINGIKKKTVSSVIVNKILEQTARGYRDSSAIKNVSDIIQQKHPGSVCGDLCMISADFESETIVVSRCTRFPVFYYQRGILNTWDTEAAPIGSLHGAHPSITEIPLELGSLIIMLSEGILTAGESTGESYDYQDLILNVIEDHNELSADSIAELFLKHALLLDQNKAHDDMTAVVMRVGSQSPIFTRRILMTCPVPKYQSIFD